MNYYKLMYDFEHDDHYADCKQNNEITDEYIVSNGAAVLNWDNSLVLEYNPKEGEVLTDYLSNVYGWLIVSERFCKLTEAFTTDAVQYLDITIKNQESAEMVKGYQVANVIDVLDAVDLNSSVYDECELEGEKYILIEKYSLKKNKIEGHSIFKLQGDTIPIFISENIKKIIENNKLKGFDFLEVNVTDEVS